MFRERVLAVAIGVGLAVPVGVVLWQSALPASLSLPDVSRFAPAAAVEQGIDEVRAELSGESSLPAWAGEYSYGNGREGAYLCLAPEAGFAFIARGCTGLYGQNHGAVRAVGSRITLTCELENEAGYRAELQTELIHVPWGTRSYLIAPEQMIAFGNDIQSGLEPRDGYGLYWMCAEADEGPVTGSPDVPEEFKAALEAPMIVATVVELLLPPKPQGGGLDTRARVRLDIGLHSGAYPMMNIVLAKQEPGTYVSAWITHADETGSTAEIYLSAELGPEDLAPEVGWVFVRRP